MTINVEGKKERHAHDVVMPHAKTAILDRFLDDLEKDLNS
jgi:histidine decarboxylase